MVCCGMVCSGAVISSSRLRLRMRSCSSFEGRGKAAGVGGGCLYCANMTVPSDPPCVLHRGCDDDDDDDVADEEDVGAPWADTDAADAVDAVDSDAEADAGLQSLLLLLL